MAHRVHRVIRAFLAHHAAVSLVDPVTAHAEVPDWFAQMVTVPASIPVERSEWLKTALYEDYHIEIPVVNWNGGCYLRISFQGYNTRDDLDALLRAFVALLIGDFA